MNPAITILLASVFGLCALLAAGGGLIHTSRKRKRAIALGGRDRPSRLLNDLQPIEDLIVDFVGHAPELREVLAVLAAADKSRSFVRIVHEIRIAQGTPADISTGAHLVGAALGILFVAGLVRLTREGFIATAAGHEVQLRLDKVPDVHLLVESKAIHGMNGITTGERNQTNKRKIIMTATDYAELEAVIDYTGKVSTRARAEFNALEGELRRAEIVEPQDIPSDVVTMNSRAELLDLNSKEGMQFTLVLPRDAGIDEGKISVLAPLGTAMLGYRVGDEFLWHVPDGVRPLKVTSVTFQPEAELRRAA